MDTKDEKKIETLGAFEVNELMLSLAQKDEKNGFFLNAGKGNPNWINTKARLAFCKLVEFCVQESERTLCHGDLAGSIETVGIYERFINYLQDTTNEMKVFFETSLNYLKNELHLNVDSIVAEWADGAIGNNYPTPNRVLTNTETILTHYLETILFAKTNLAEQTQVFPTEGGSAAMVYIFNSLKENKLIQLGDKIAISSPIFTPYIQIPELNDYEMVEIDLRATEKTSWEVPIDEFDKLKDPTIKALFLVNPSNPGSKALGEKELQKIKAIVDERPELMIITDDVYGSFVKDFQSVYSVVPQNTLLVYSYSKLFGATGWRIGLIALNKENVFDQLIQQLSEGKKDELKKRYESVVLKPSKMKFVDRLVADSRSIGLYHTSGLSTPQQIMEVLFSLTHLISKKEQDHYITESKKLISTRYDLLHEALNYPKDSSRLNAKYYSLINIYDLAEQLYGTAFKNHLSSQFEEVDFLLNLAKKNGVVLMDGVGFGTNPGEVRVSSANLPTKDYPIIGKQILELLADYYKEYQNS